MHPLIIALTLLVTICAALALGVILGYAAINAVLHAMRRRPQPVLEGSLAATEASGGV